MSNEGGRGLTLLSVIIGILVSSVVAVSSVYIAIMLSALPWPIIIAVIMSYALFRVADKIRGGKSNIHQLNVAQAAGSIGGLVGAAIVFTVPAILFLGGDLSSLPSPFVVWLVAMLGGLLGVSFSIHVKRITVDMEDLAFPSGTAGAEVLLALGEKRYESKLLFEFLSISFAISAIILWFFGVPVRNFFVSFGNIVLVVGIYLSLAAVGVGYIVGGRSSSAWFIGAVLGWIVLVAFLQLFGFTFEVSLVFVQRLGIGLVFGFGLAFFLMHGAKSIHKTSLGGSLSEYRVSAILVGISLLVLSLIGINVLATLIAIIGAWIMSFIAGKTTGETDIDPLEQFGLFVGLVVLGFLSLLGFRIGIKELILIITFVSAAASLAGDIGHDFKSAKIIGTRDMDIFWVDFISVIFGGAVATMAMFVVLHSYINIILKLPSVAFQSKLVAAVLRSAEQPITFYIGLVLGLLAGLMQSVSERARNIVSLVLPFGIGMFLGLTLAIPIIIGGLISIIYKDREKGIIIASGLLAGEGLSGFIIGAINILL